jgi:hypothetical protein
MIGVPETCETIAREDLARTGCCLLSNVLSADRVREILTHLQAGLARHTDDVCTSHGTVYAARNVLEFAPEVASVRRIPVLDSFLNESLGADFGLVRGLFFDKPPGQSWALPWHKDLSIAVAGPHAPQPEYSVPRLKRGVWHCEPPLDVLERMLTLRIHLDDMTPTNGPLEVLLESHHTGKELRMESYSPRTILGQAGDVFAMRPLLVHRSGRSHPDSLEHRRILHLEFAASADLPAGVRWHTFLR